MWFFVVVVVAVFFGIACPAHTGIVTKYVSVCLSMCFAHTGSFLLRGACATGPTSSWLARTRFEGASKTIGFS